MLVPHDAETGDEVPNENIIKGYEVAKGEYVEFDLQERISNSYTRNQVHKESFN
jgi:non-homologous end joining protein Ku